MRLRSVSVLACCAWTFGACQETRIFHLPDTGRADAKSAVLIIGADRLTARLYGMEIDDPLPAFSAPLGSVIAAVYYPDPVEVHQLGPGEIAHVEDGRPLPPGEVFLLNDDFTDWALRPLPQAIRDLRIARFDHNRCVKAKGCVPLSGDEACDLSCPTSTVAEPAWPDPPCPPEWIQDAEPGPLGISTCRPEVIAEAGCTGPDAQFYGERSCTTIGSVCPTQAWPVGLPNDGTPILYVDASVSPGGDGTISSPFSTIQDAVDAASPGDAIALSKHHHAGRISINKDDLRIIGACPSGTSIEGADVGGLRISFENLEINGADPAISVGGGLRLQNSLVSGSGRIEVDGGNLIASNTVVRAAGGLDLKNATADIDRLVFDGPDLVAISCKTNSTLTSNRTVVRHGTTADGTGGIWAEGCRLSMSGVDIIGTQGHALFLDDATTATVSDLTVLMDPQDGNDGFGISIRGSSVRLERAYIDGARGLGIGANESSISARDVVVRQTRVSSGWPGDGVNLKGGTADIERMFLDRNSTDAFETNMDCVLIASDLVIRGESNAPSNVDRKGLHLRDSSSATLKRVIIEDAFDYGMDVNEVVSVDASDVTVVGAGAVGLEIRPGSPKLFQRVRIDGAGGFGVQIEVPKGIDQPELTEIEDLDVRDSDTGLFAVGKGEALITRAAWTGSRGAALDLAATSELTVKEGTISNNHIGVLHDEDTQLRIRAVRFFDNDEDFSIRQY